MSMDQAEGGEGGTTNGMSRPAPPDPLLHAVIVIFITNNHLQSMIAFDETSIPKTPILKYARPHLRNEINCFLIKNVSSCLLPNWAGLPSHERAWLRHRQEPASLALQPLHPRIRASPAQLDRPFHPSLQRWCRAPALEHRPPTRRPPSSSPPPILHSATPRARLRGWEARRCPPCPTCPDGSRLRLLRRSRCLTFR